MATHPPQARIEFYFIDEVAAQLRRSVAATRWLINTGRIGSSKLGGRRIVTQKQLDDFFAEAFGEDG